MLYLQPRVASVCQAVALQDGTQIMSYGRGRARRIKAPPVLQHTTCEQTAVAGRSLCKGQRLAVSATEHR